MTPAELAAYGMSEDAWAESLAGRHNRQAIRDHAPAASNREARQHRLAERLARAEASRSRSHTPNHWQPRPSTARLGTAARRQAPRSGKRRLTPADSPLRTRVRGRGAS